MQAQTLISEVMRQEVAVAADVLLKDIEGWDSLNTVRLMVRLEEIVGRELSEEELEGIVSVTDVQSLLDAHG